MAGVQCVDVCGIYHRVHVDPASASAPWSNARLMYSLLVCAMSYCMPMRLDQARTAVKAPRTQNSHDAPRGAGPDEIVSSGLEAFSEYTQTQSSSQFLGAVHVAGR